MTDDNITSLDSLIEFKDLSLYNLSYLDFSKKYLTKIVFDNSVLYFANFTDTVLRDCSFRNVNLSNSKLIRTKIHNTKIVNSNFSNAIISDVEIEESFLKDNKEFKY